ncbi:MAG: exonuclease SbcCD subunit D C-terminal domain-containing protein, partial [Clostridia bacterium]|nr:exonuclease SbcCD subunit D C-terminal domain-containing protein [Clostridia bacterium]
DVYDKSVPSAEAVELYDEFITALANEKTQTYIISGNHDSPERLGCCSKLISSNKIYIDSIFNGKAVKYTLKDETESVNIYALPFIKPANVRAFYKEQEINNYTQAVKLVLDNSDIAPNQTNILVAHQYVTNGGEMIRTDSEAISVGGIDNVSSEVFDSFNYVALGHLHAKQNIDNRIVYCGSPLKYSKSECKNKKSVVMLEVTNGEIAVNEIPLTPLRDMRIIKGNLKELTENPVGDTQDYIFAELTDENEQIDAIGNLRSVYPNVMGLSYNNKRTAQSQANVRLKSVSAKSSIELFEDFYKQQNGDSLNAQQKEIVLNILNELEGDR